MVRIEKGSGDTLIVSVVVQRKPCVEAAQEHALPPLKNTAFQLEALGQAIRTLGGAHTALQRSDEQIETEKLKQMAQLQESFDRLKTLRPTLTPDLAAE